MLEAKLLHKKTNKKCKGCKDGGIYQNLWPIPLLISVILSKIAVREEWEIPVCLADNDKNMRESFAWGHD